MTRSAADVLADLAALAQRQAQLTAELALAMRTPVAAPAGPAEASPEYLTTAEAAAFLGVSERTLKTLRAEGRGPAFARVGRAVRYSRNALLSAVQLPSSPAPAAPSSEPSR